MTAKRVTLDERLMRVRRLVWLAGNQYDPPGIHAIVQLGDEEQGYMIYVRHEEEPPTHLIKHDSYCIAGHKPVQF